MGMVDKELLLTHVREERLLRFREFVKEQKILNIPGMKRACLHNNGHRDYFGEVHFGAGMHGSLWILPVDRNPNALIYTNRTDAKEYAKTLQKVLRDNGYPFSRVWVEPVAVRRSKSHPYSGFILPQITFECTDRYIIQMTVK